ncbi:hypothetical protein ACU686_44700 [Yinghuangia aomiensis]
MNVPTRLRYPVDEAAVLLGISRTNVFGLIKSWAPAVDARLRTAPDSGHRAPGVRRALM